MALRKLVSSLCTILLSIVVFACLPVHASSSIPQFFNYQGRLLTSGGTNVTDGTYAIKFSLYDAATGGTPIWTASGTTGLPTALNVTVTNGLFSVLLGDASFQSQNSLSALDWDQDGLYLGITVGSDSEMTPRKKLSSVPFALNAGQLQGQYASSSVASTGGNLFEVHQTTADSASAQRTALSIKTEGTNNSNDFLIVGKNDSSDVFTVSRQGSVTTTGNLASNGNVTLGDTTSDRVVFNAYVMSDVLPATDLAYRLGDSSHRWLGLDVGTVTTTNLFATTVSSTNALFANATTTNLYSTTVSTTQLFVNGQAISSGVPATTATLQTISDNGATTTNLIYAFGGINTSNLTATGTTSLQNTTLTNATATAVTSTNLFSTFGTITTLGSTYLTATQATATTLAFTNASGSSLMVSGQNVCLANGTNCVNGTLSTLQVVTTNGNISNLAIGVAGVSSTGDILPTTSALFNVGSPTKSWQNVYASGTAYANQGIVIGTTSTALAGGIRWTGTDFEGNDGTNWKTLTQASYANSEPTGFPDTASTLIAFTTSTLTFAIGPKTGSTWYYYSQGVRYDKTGTSTATITDTEGVWFFYFNAGTLTASQSVWSLKDVAPVAYIYWDATNKSAIVLGDERHGMAMDYRTHEYLHATVGTRYASGLSLTGTTGGNGSIDQHAQVSLTNGVIYDEDLKFTITHANPATAPFEQVLTPTATIPVYYRSGTTAWRKYPATNFPLYWTPAGRANYNLNTAGSWSSAEATNNTYVAVWLFATNNQNEPVVAIMGQRNDATLALAQASNTFDGLSLSGLNVQEMKLIYRLIFLTRQAYSNTPKSSLQAVTDYRTVRNLPSGNYIANAHGQLTGLLNDDHTQYFLSAGRLYGQTWYGGREASENLILDSTSDVSKGSIVFQPSGGNVGIGTLTPTAFMLQIAGSVGPSSTNAYDVGSATLSWRSVYASGTSQLAYVSSTAISVGGQAVCLANGTNCQTVTIPSGAYAWTDDATNNLVYNTTATRDVLLGGSTTDTAGFIFDKGTNTSTVIIGNQTGNANLLVGTTTYGGGLNSNFQVNGNDIYAQGMIGSQEGIFSATGVTVGTGSTIYGDGNLYKTTSGDFTLALNNTASNWRFRTGVGESFTVASSGKVGIGVSTPLEALDVSGTIRNVLQSGQTFNVLSTISGITTPTNVRVRGRYAYVSTANGFLRVYDVTNPLSPAYLSQVSFGGNSYTLRVSSNFAYVVNDAGNALKVIDISNPSNPAVVGTVTTNNAPRGLYVDGGYAYVANTTANSVQIIDISNPTAPTIVKTMAGVSTAPKQVYKSGKYLYLVSASSNDLKIIDVSDPVNAYVVGTVAVGTYANDVMVEGRYAYVANYSSDNVSVVDISNPAAPSVAATISLLATDGPSDLFVSGRNLLVTNYDSGSLSVYDVANPVSPVSISKKTIGSAAWGVDVAGRVAYVAAYSAGTVTLLDLKGLETSSLSAASAEVGSLSVLTNSSIYNQLTVGGGLVVGPGGLLSQGALAISSTNTTSTFVFAVSSSYAEISNRLTVGGQAVCLANGTNCQSTPSGSFVWTESSASNTLYNANSSRDVLIGGSTTATANFILDKGTTTSTVIVGSYTGNANLLVGTTTYGGGLNSNFITNGNDVYAQGMIGSQEGLFSATGVTVGLGTTVYGDGNLYKTNAGDFTLALNDTASNWRFRTGVGEAFTVASTGNIGIGVTTPLEALDVSGTIDQYPQATSTLAYESHYYVGSNVATFMALQGNYLYTIGNIGHAFQVVDVTDKNYPRMVTSTALPNDGGCSYMDVKVRGNYAFLPFQGNCGHGIRVLDISNPYQPYSVYKLTGMTPNSQTIEIQGNYAYVGHYWNNGIVSVLDITDPTKPYVVKTIQLVGYGPKTLRANGRFLYAADAGGVNGLHIFDISDPRNTTLVTSTSRFGNLSDIEVQGDYLFGAYSSGQFVRAVDISDPSNPVSVGTVNTPEPSTYTYSLSVSGRTLMVTDTSGRYSALEIDIQNPSAMKIVGVVPYNGRQMAQCGGANKCSLFVGGYFYFTSVNPAYISIVDIRGTVTNGLAAASAEVGGMNVRRDAAALQGLTIGKSLEVTDGMTTLGPLTVSATNTTSTFLGAVSSTNGEFSNRLTVGGQRVCLFSGVGCVSGANIWAENATGNIIYPAIAGRDLLLGGSTTATAGFIFDKGTGATSTVIIGNQTGNANLLVGATAYGGGLNSAFAANGNDIYAAGMIGSQEGLFSATGVRVGLNTTVYGDGNLYGTGKSALVYSEGFESGSFGSGWTTGGNASWAITTEEFYSGIRSASSGKIGASGNTWLDYDFSTTAPAGFVQFWWKTNSEANYDFLEVCIDSDALCDRTNYYSRISGSPGWTLFTVPFSGSGSHSVRWLYTKDGSGDTGKDAGWVDGVEIYTYDDYRWTLNDPASNWRFNAGGQEAFMVASSGVVGLGGHYDSRYALDVWGNIDNTLQSTARIHSIYSSTTPASMYGNAAVLGDYAYVPNITASGWLSVIDIKNPANPKIVGAVNTGSGSNNVGVLADAGYVYLFGRTGATLYVVDVTRPSNPRVISTLGGFSNHYGHLAKSGRYLYVGDYGSNSVKVVDVGNPAAPAIVGSASITGSGANSAAYQGGYVFSANYTNGTLSAVDVTNAASPRLISSLSLGTANPSAVVVSGRYAYVSHVGSSNLEVVDITNPASMRVVKVFAMAGQSNYDNSSMDIKGHYLYAPIGIGSTIQVVDVASSTNPVSMGTFSTGGNPMSVVVQGKYAHVYSLSGYRIHDIQGIETGSLTAASAEFGALNANGLILSGQLTVGGGLSVGMSGMRSLGSLAISSTNTTSTFSYAVSATQARFSRQLTADQFLRVNNRDNADIAAQIGGSIKNVPTTGQTYQLLYSTSTDSNGYCGALDIQGNYLVQQTSSFVRTLDITQPALPKVIGSLATGGTGGIGDMHVRGRYAYGTRSNNSSVDIYDLSNPGAPTLAQAYGAGNTVNTVAVQGNYLYYTRFGFYVQNIANPTSQVAVSSAYLPGTPNRVVVQGNYAYVTNNANYLHIIDISNKLRPTVMSTTTVATANDVVVQGRYAYVGNGSNVLVYDVKNPASPTLVKTVALGSGTVYQMVIDGDALHVAAETLYAQIDISDPVNAFVNGTRALTTVREIAVKGRYAYLGSYTSPSNLYILDTKGMETSSMTAQSAEFGSLQVQGSMQSARDFTVNGALFAGRGGIMSNGPLSVQSTTTAATVYASTNDFYDLGAPDKAFRDVRSSRTAYLNNAVMSSSTTQLYSTSYPPTIATSTFLAGAGPGGLAIRGNYLYVGNYTNDTFSVLDVSDKTWPKVVGNVALTAGFDPYKMALNGDYAYVLNYSNSSFSVINISRPSSPILVRTITAYATPRGAAVYGKYLYVVFANAATGFAVYDISDPSNPVFQNVMAVTGGNPYGIAVQGRYAYVPLNNGASVAGAMKTYDLSLPSAPTLVSSLTLTGNNGAYEIAVQGKYAYIPNWDTGTLSIISIANPTSPSVIASPNIGTTNDSVAVSGRYAFVTQYTNNALKVLDIQNPASASVVATVNLSATPWYMIMSGRYAYIPANGANKIDIVDLHGYETESLDADSAEMGSLSVLTNTSIDGSLVSGGSLVISDSWMSQGSLAISSTNTTSTFLYAVSATAGEFSGRLTVGGVSVCLKDTTNCRDWYTGVWQDDANGNLVYPSSTVRDIMFGGSTTATAGFIFDRGVTTSTVLIGNQTGNANLLVGTTTYGGGLNSAFATNGNDIFAQGMIGSLEGLYSATGVRVGTGTSVYGDGTLWKTTNGDFSLNAFTLQESFESVTFPPNSNWSTGGDAVWVRTTATSTDGSASASSSKMLDNQLEWLDYRFNSTMSGQVTFKWKVSSEANWDFLAVCMDQLDSNCTRVGSGRYAYISGVTNWASVTVPFTGAGSHKIRWIYAKDSSQSSYLDAGWVDDVRINSGWRFYAGGSERLTVASSGNIGIGVATPLSTLDMTGNIDLTLHTTVNVPTLATLTVGTNPESFVVWGKYAAVSNYGGNNISIVDLSDPSKPAVVSTVVLNCPQGIDVNGRYMFVTNACSGSLNIYDISNPSSVSLVKSFTQPFLRGLKAVGKNVYTLAKTFVTAGKFAITDVSDPYFPFTSASTTTGEPSGSYAFLDVQGQYAYLALTTANRMEIWDVSNSSNPVLATSTITGTSPRAVKVQGGYAYLTTASSNYLQIYDVSSSTYPVLVKSVTVGSGPHGLDVSGRYAYVANSSANTVSIVDISSSTAASVVKTVTVGSAPWEVKVSGKYMYVTNRTSNTLTIHDISGLETNALIAASAEFGNLNVRSNASVFNNFNIGGGLSVGQGGIYANGPLGVYATSTFVQSVMNTGSMLVGATGTNIGERLQVEGNILIRKRSSAVAEAWNATGTSYTNVPTVRSSHAAVWTGSKMVVWGGENSGGYLNTGAVYDPANDTWKTITTTNAPTARRGHTAVWTGSKMVVWGGYGAAGSVNTGGIYDPLTDSWKTITTTNAPTARYMHTAVWTGSKMVVWGGDDGTIGGCDTGSVYDPVTNAWTTMTTTNAPQARYSHGAIWMTPSGTSSKMFVWGGNGAGEGQSGGGMYDPANNSWTKTAASEPQPRASYGIVWTGSKVIIHGGYYSGVLNSGAIFDPVANSWTNITTTNAPTRTLYSAVWTGSRMIVWGGSTDGFATGVVNTGASYDPYANTWTSMTNTNAPVARFGQTAVWTGSRMVAWGGQGSSAYLNSGRIYTPAQYQGNLMAEGDMYIGGSAQVVGDIHAGGFYSKSGSDFAEYMPVDTSMAAPEAGDVVILSEGSGNRIAKSSASSRRFLVGAITNRPAVVGNADPAFKDDPGYALVSMLGQVDVKFSPKNGDIAPGDYLTAGDDGYAVKAKGPGPILGQALQAGDTTSSVLTYVNPQWWAGDLLSAEGDANFLKSDLAVSSKGIATSSTTAFGSSLFSFQGSAWDETSQSAVPTSFSMRNDTVSPTSSFFTLSFATGTDMQSPVLSISNLGDVNVSGDLTVGRRLYLGSKTSGTGSSSTYIYVDDTLAPSSTYIATNADGWQTSSTYDYAERYESGEKLNPGDLVTSDDTGINKVKKAASSLEPILGIVSTKPGFITGGYLKDSYPIALAGRVPTRVSTQNGAILVGDYLTVSDLNPGLAVKAVQSGNIVGIALESFDQPGEGTISVFVKPGYQNILNADSQTPVPSAQAQSTGTGTGSVRSGLAKIYAGMKEVKVTYESIGAYPIVNVRPYAKVTKHFWVIDATDRSFTIVVGEAPQSDVVFSWTVLPSQAGNAIYFSDETSIPYDPTTGLPIGPLPPASPITPPTNTETNSSTQP